MGLSVVERIKADDPFPFLDSPIFSASLCCAASGADEATHILCVPEFP